MTADPSLAALAEAILVPPFRGTTPPGWLLDALGRGLGGVTLFGPNIADPEQVATLTARLRDAADEPVIAVDEEGGDVTRIAHLTGSPYPGNAALGVVDDTALTTEIYRALGSDLAAVGINVDLAPSADVNSADDNPVIGTRSFGPDAALVARHAAAAVAGLQSAGIAACAKHFPGHGSTSKDSHHVVATVDGGLAELRDRDLPPFVAAIEAGVRAIMPGHLRVAGLTGGLPATWSAAAITGLLRGELGFTGVVVTDALEMRAVSEPHGLPEAAVAAVAAGADLLCLGRDQDEDMYLAVRDAIVAAITGGRLPAGRVAEAGGRVAGLRSWLARRRPGAPPAGLRHDIEAGLAAARRALRVTGLSRPLADPVVVELRPLRNIAVGSVPWGLEPWLDGSVYRIDTAAGDSAAGGTASDGTAAGGAVAGDAVAGDAGQAAAIGNVLARAAGRPLVVVVRDAHRHPVARAAATALLAARPDAVVVEMGLPVWRPASGGYLATYGAARPNGQAAAEALGLAAAQPA